MTDEFERLCEDLYDTCLKHQWSKLKRWSDLDPLKKEDAHIMRDVSAVAYTAFAALVDKPLTAWFDLYCRARGIQK